MQIGAKHSHLHGEEYLIVHQSELWQEVQEVIAAVDAEACRTRSSGERGRGGEMLYSPTEMNKAFHAGFNERGWHAESQTVAVTSDEERSVTGPSTVRPQAAIQGAGRETTVTCQWMDFVKSRVAAEVHFGEYSFAAQGLARHLSHYVSDAIDVGVEILPMADLTAGMSAAIPCYERDLPNLLRQGRGVPAVPLVLVGVKP